MKLRRTIPPWLALTSTLLTACAVEDGADSVGETEQAVDLTPYEKLRGVQDYFELPAASATIDVGTFNTQTGTFTGAVTEIEVVQGPNGQPIVKKIHPKRDIDAVRAVLRFNAPPGSTVTIAGVSKTVQAGQSFVEMEVGRSVNVDWTIQFGTKTYTDKLIVTRTSVVYAGAFRVEAVPVAIVYAPSQPTTGSASAVFGTSQTHTTTLQLTNQHASTDKTEKHIGAGALVEEVASAATYAASLGVPGASTAKDIATSLSGVFPQTTVVETVQISDTAAESAEVKVTFTSQDAPFLATGPGSGDLILVLRDAEIGFVYDRGQLSWTVLGGADVQGFAAQTLLSDLALLDGGLLPSDTNSGFGRDTIEALLALDPFVDVGSTAFLDPERYSFIGVKNADQSSSTFGVSTTVSSSTTTATSTTHSRIVDNDPGILATLGFARPSHNTTTMTVGRSTSTSSSATSSSSISHTGVSQTYFYQVYFDRLFGTFVARTAMPMPDPVWSSQFRNDQGWHTSPGYWGTIRFPDVNGDGLADVCGRGAVGIQCQRSNDASFGSISTWQASYSDANGWSNAIHAATIRFPDLNGDGKADVCGRGSGGLACAVSTGTAFGAATFWTPAFSNATEFDNGPQYYETIAYPDLNGDGKDDVCGRGASGVQCALSTGTAFGAATVWGASFSDQNAWGSSPAYWSTLRFADIDGDGKDDLCGRGTAGMYCQKSTGTTFGAVTLWTTQLGNANGWFADASRYSTIQLGDLDNDGKADLCARDITGLRCGRSSGNAFVNVGIVAVAGFNDAAGFAAEPHYRAIVLVDADRDGKVDACGRDATGVVCAKSTSVPGANPSFGPLTRVVDGFTDAELPDVTSWATLRPANVQGTTGGVEWCARTSGGIRCSDRP